MEDRYVLSDETGHACCMCCSVVDNATLNDYGEPTVLCECYDKCDAELIARALNHLVKDTDMGGDGT